MNRRTFFGAVGGFLSSLGYFGAPAQSVVSPVGRLLRLFGFSDSQRLQSALDALGRDGGTIYLTEGVYHLNAPLTFCDGGAVCVVGRKGEKTVLMSTGPAFRFDV